MGTLFHNYKLLFTLDNKERKKVIDSNLNPDLTFQRNSKTRGDILFFLMDLIRMHISCCIFRILVQTN
jgi:hypothetical protein